MLQFLEGKKTYIVIIAALIYAGSGWYTHYLSPKEATDIIFTALGAGGFRSAIATLIDQS